MVKWLRRVRDRLAESRADQRATRGERILRKNEAKAQRRRHERFDNKAGPLGGGRI